MTRRIKAVVAYDGSDYKGFQRQSLVPTIQEELESALNQLFDEGSVIHGAGRTDAGVHAIGQVIHFDLSHAIPVDQIPRAFNSTLPRSITVTAAEVVAESFHAQFDAVEKSYRYLLCNEPYPNPLLRRYACFFPRPLDREAMVRAAGDFVGEHDFASFQSSGREAKKTVRVIGDFTLESEKWQGSELLVFRITGDGFLYKMARGMVGTLIEIGAGRLAPDSIAAILATRDRREAGYNAPAHGLYLDAVHYA